MSNREDFHMLIKITIRIIEYYFCRILLAQFMLIRLSEPNDFIIDFNYEELKRRWFPMTKKSKNIDPETRKAQMEMHNREITKTLRHIKNKILVMSGLKWHHCGKIIDVFKRRGGAETARKENLRLLATLPLERAIIVYDEATADP